MNADQRILDAALRQHFLAFAHRFFLMLNPEKPFLHTWHLELIAWYLEQVIAGKIKRLIINLPPRSLKSHFASVAFPAFWLGHQPHRKIFGISYGADLAAKHGADCRSIMESSSYRRLFPNSKIARVVDSNIYTTRRGFRMATSTHAALTGLGGDCFIIDDPLKPIDAQSEALRNGVNEWFSSTLLSRLDDKVSGAIIIVMQRVHQYDLTGYLLERSSKDWVLLKLPAIAEEFEEIEIGPGRIHRRQPGEALHPERESAALLEKLRSEFGLEHFAAQYQQSPVPFGGAMIQRAWLRYYDVLPAREYPATVIQSWDTATKNGAQNDYSVCTTLLVKGKKFYLMDVTRGRFDYPTLQQTALALADEYEPDVILCEDASTGTPLSQELEQAGKPVRLVPIEFDKRARLYVQEAKFERGQVLFPRGASFLPDLEAELLAFPQSKYDDQVDSLTQALAWGGATDGYDSTLSWV